MIKAEAFMIRIGSKRHESQRRHAGHDGSRAVIADLDLFRRMTGRSAVVQ